jgi:regulator of sigma E protease
VGPVEAADLSVSSMWNVTTLTVDRLAKIFVSSKARKDVSGVVGSYEATRQSFAFDTTQALRILALISLSLGVINLFPFLPLDGGHIFWAIAEKIRGRPIPFAVLERASVIGIMLVALLFVIGLSNDIGRITSGEGFGVR